jgi:dTDP-4-amino-4,6-dideoxygalactose transaminase
MKADWPYEFPGAYWIDEQEEQAVLDVLRKGSLFRYYGLNEATAVDSYEAAAREFYGAQYALGVSSGTGALFAAMAALDVGPGSEVILPAFHWVAITGAIVQLGAIPVFGEVDDSLSLDPADLEKMITPRTKLIVAVHMAGAPADLDAILAVADRHGIPVLEDVAQCNGGSYKGKKLGTIGAMGIFSLQLNKNMTCGEGGLVVTDDEMLYTRAFAAHDHGMIRVGGRLAPPPPEALMWGSGRRMPELCGAVAKVQLGKLPDIIAAMRASKARVKAMLEGTPGLGFRRMNDLEGETGPFLIMMLADEAKAVAATQKMLDSGLHNVFRVADYGCHMYYNIPALVGKVGVSSAGNPWSLAENAESVYDYNKGACPQSDALFARSILLPIPSRLTEEQERQGAEAVKAAVTG